MTKPVMVIQSALFTRDYNYRYLLKLISICGHFQTVNNRRYGRCHIKYIIPLCTFLEFYAHLEGNSARLFENAFCKCSRALNVMFLKTLCFC